MLKKLFLCISSIYLIVNFSLILHNLVANYQKQFSKFDESPNVQSVGIHANAFDRVGIGAYFFRDQNGPISANGIAIGASYFVPLSDEDGRKDQFSFGTSVNFYNQNFDVSKEIQMILCFTKITIVFSLLMLT